MKLSGVLRVCGVDLAVGILPPMCWKQKFVPVRAGEPQRVPSDLMSVQTGYMAFSCSMVGLEKSKSDRENKGLSESDRENKGLTGEIVKTKELGG